MENETTTLLTKLMGIQIAIALQAQSKNEGTTLRNQITFLNSSGLNAKEIASILGKTGSHINKELSLARKK